MKKLLLFLVCLLFVSTGMSQRHYDRYSIRNYQKSLVVEIKQQRMSKVILNEFGKIYRLTNPTNVHLNYLFNGQEYEPDLALYLYPNRTYSALKQRFLEVDPLSQYVSPYSFVGADPVNYIDLSGRQSKPLVLHNTNLTEASGMDVSTLDLQAQIGDAYYVPLKDVVNGEIGDLSEFNGTIFIDSHMGTDFGGNIQVESDNGFHRFQSLGKDSKAYLRPNLDAANNHMPKYKTSITGEDLGRKLRAISDEKGLEVKNIVAGGCHGQKAAESIGKGFTERPSAMNEGAEARAKLTTTGIDEDAEVIFVGDRSLKMDGFAPIGETRMYGIPSGYKINYGADLSTTPKTFDGIWFTNPAIDGQEFGAAEVSGKEVSAFAREARIPSAMPDAFKQFHFEY